MTMEIHVKNDLTPMIHGKLHVDTHEMMTPEKPNLHAALQRVCVQLASDLGTYGKLNIMWMSHADHDISRRGHFDKAGCWVSWY